MSLRLYLARLTVWLLVMLGGYGVAQAQNSITSLSVAGGATAACGGTTITIVPAIQVTNPTTATAITYSPVLNGVVGTQFQGSGNGLNGVYTIPAVTTSSTLVIQATGAFSNGTTSTSSLTLTVNPSVGTPFSITPSATAVCATGSLTFTAPSGLTINSVFGPGSHTLSTTNANSATTTLGATPTGLQTFTFNVSNASSCSATSTVDVTINPIPTVTISFSNTLLNCNNPTTIATANVSPAGSYTYAWSGTGGTGTASSTTYTYPGTGSGPIDFSVVVTSAGGCTATGTSSVSADRVPAPLASLTVVGAYTPTSNSAATAGGTQSITVCSGASLTINTDCVIAYSSTVTPGATVPPLTGVNTGATGIDSNTAGAGTGTGGTSSTTTSGTVTAAFTGVFTAAVTTTIPYTFVCVGTNGCASPTATTLNVTINPTPSAPTIAGFPSSATICQSPTALTAITASCPTGQTAIVALSGTGFTGNANSTSVTTSTIAANSTGVFGYTAVCATSSCTSVAATRSLTIVAAPNDASLTVVGATAAASVTTASPAAGGNVSICSGTSLTIQTNCLIAVNQSSTSGSTNPPLTGVNSSSTNVDNGTSGTATAGGGTSGSTTSTTVNAAFTASFTATGSYVYTFVCTNLAGCSSTAVTSLSITVNQTPSAPTIAGFPSSATICQSPTALTAITASCPTGQTAIVALSGTGFTGNANSTSVTTSTIAANSTGVFGYTAVCATSSCTSVAATRSLTIVPAPNNASLTVVGTTAANSVTTATSSAGANVTICSGTSLTIQTDCQIAINQTSTSGSSNPPLTGVNSSSTNVDNGTSGTAVAGGSTSGSTTSTTVNAAFTGTFTATSTSSYVYTFVCTNAAGCSSTAVTSLSVTINPTPSVATVSGIANTSICTLKAVKAVKATCATNTTAVVTVSSEWTGVTPTNSSSVTSVNLPASTSGVFGYTVVCVNSSSCASAATTYSQTIVAAPNDASLTVLGGNPANTAIAAKGGASVSVCAGSSLTVLTDCIIGSTVSTTDATTNPIFTGGNSGGSGVDSGTAGTGAGNGGTSPNSATANVNAFFTATFSTTTAAPLVYTFVCTNAANCSSTGVTSLSISVVSQAVAPTVAGLTTGTICQSTSPIAVTATCATGAVTVRTTGAGFTVAAGTGTRIATIGANRTGVFGYTAICATASCTSTSETRSLTIVQAPNTASLTVVGATGTAPSVTICSGNSLTINTDCQIGASVVNGTSTGNPTLEGGNTGGSGTDTGSSGTATAGGSTTTAGSNTPVYAYFKATFNAATTTTYVYTFVCTNTAGCSSTAVTSLSITVNPTPSAPQPVASVGTLPSITVCQGTPAISVSALCPTSSTIVGGRVSGTTAAATRNATTGTLTIPTTTTGVGSYSIACVNSSGCPSSVYTFTVTVNAAPANATVTASASGNTLANIVGASGQTLTICKNDPVSLTFTGCTMVTTPGSGGTSSPIVSITGVTGGISGGGTSGTTSNTMTGQLLTAGLATGTYTVTLACTNESGCQSRTVTSFSLVITDAPTAPASITYASTCGGAVNAVATLACTTGMVYYTATVGTSTTDVTGTASGAASTASLTFTKVGTYTLVAQCGTTPTCVSSATTVVFNNRLATPVPQPISALPNSICSGQGSVLSASGCVGGTINWYVSGSNTIIGTGSSVTVTPTASTAYQANCTMNGCTSAKTTAQLVTVTPGPGGIPSLQALPNPVAAGASVTLTAFGCAAGEQVIIFSDAAGTTEVGRTSGTSNSLVVNPTVNTTYYGQCFNGTCRGMLSPSGTPVVVQACNFVATVTPSSAVLCPGGSTVLTASGGSTYQWSNGANTQQITVMAPGTYNVVVTTAQGCTAAASVVVTAGQVPQLSITGNTNIVQGQSTQLTVSGGVTYLWSTGSTLPTITVNAAGTYSVIATGPTGCTATVSATVTVQPLPAAPSVTPGTNLNVCLGGNVLLTASCATGQPRFNRGNVSVNAPTYLVESPIVGTVNINAVCVVNGIEGTPTPVAVTFNAAPNVTISGSPVICRDLVTGAITGATFTASGATSYLWSNGATTPSISVSVAGTYSVTGVTTGCSGVAQVVATSQVCGQATPLVITGASINCSTREITITTSGGNGQPVERMIQLVTTWTPAGQPLLLDAAILADANNSVVQLFARQVGGNTAGPFVFNFRTTCPATSTPPSSTTTTPPPATGNTITVCGQPYTLTGAPFSVSATFTCNEGTTPHLINFMPSGGVVDANSVIEFMSIGITPWTQSCTETLDLNNTDYNTFTINARQRNTQTGAILAMAQITVTSPCVKKAAGGREAVTEKGELDVTVLGNPTLGDKVDVEVRGAEGQQLQLRMTNGQGASVSEVTVEKANSVERQTIGLGRSAGMYFLQVITPTKVKTVKVVRQ